MIAEETWPTETIPYKFQRQGYNETSKPNKIRTSMEAGEDKVRRRYTSAINNLSGSIWMNLDQMNLFKSFYNIDLSGGVEAFNFPIPSSETEETAITRIIGEPTYVNIGGRNWVVGLQMEQV